MSMDAEQVRIQVEITSEQHKSTLHMSVSPDTLVIHMESANLFWVRADMLDANADSTKWVALESDKVKVIY
jgi:hypothetical protein